MSSLVNGCIEAMLNKVAQTADSKDKEINIYELYKRMTMDVICKQINLEKTTYILMYLYSGRCAFGIDTDMQNDINNPYLQKSAAIFELDIEK